MSWKIIIAALLLALVVTMAACTQTTATPNTTPPANSSTTNAPPAVQAPPPAVTQPPKEQAPKLIKVGDLLSNPNAYKGQLVALKGKVVTLCGGNGCWFTLNDGSGTIYVDLAPSNLTLAKQKLGATITVYGELTQAKGDTYLIGKKVEF
ncbi:MAG: hypothetical protein FJ008_08630 [Chloroflexi bacterium]|nr:hypothetical protein [Chloroflexota bacterium]